MNEKQTENWEYLTYDKSYTVHVSAHTRVDGAFYCCGNCDRENVSFRILSQPHGSDLRWVFCDDCYAQWAKNWEAKGGLLKEQIPMKEISKKAKQWLAIRKEEAQKIDPETCEVFWCWGYDDDPYDVMDPAVLEAQFGGAMIGRQYFARNHGSDIGVWFHDLPKATRDALWKRPKDGSFKPPRWE